LPETLFHAPLCPKERPKGSLTPKETAITKKRLWIIAAVAAAALLWETLLGWLGHAVILALEWLELTVDTIFEELLSFTPEASQMATAWTGFVVLLVLLGWGGYRLRQFYLGSKDRAIAWKQEKQEAFYRWWGGLPWFKKLGYAASVCAFLTLMILTS
jgi:hypothetical protein